MDRDAPDHSPRVGHIYSSVPPEILHAFGRVPVRVFSSARNSADAEAYLPKNFCALAKITLASFLDDAGSHSLEGIIFADDCDAQRRLHDVWRAYASIPALAVLDLPRRTDSLGQGFFAAALDHLIEQLEQQYGQRLTAGALIESIRLYNEQRELWLSLRRAWLAGRVSTARYYELRAVRLTDHPLRTKAAIAAALQAATAARDRGGQARLLLMGSHHVHLGLVDAIEEDGRACIVGEESAADEREVMQSIQTNGTRAQLVAGLAAHYLGLPGPRQRDVPRRLDHLARLAAERGADGVICSYYKFCDLYLAEFPIVKRFFESRKIPVLLLEDEGEPMLSGQARTRLQAFIEMLGSSAYAKTA